MSTGHGTTPPGPVGPRRRPGSGPTPPPQPAQAAQQALQPVHPPTGQPASPFRQSPAFRPPQAQQQYPVAAAPAAPPAPPTPPRPPRPGTGVPSGPFPGPGPAGTTTTVVSQTSRISTTMIAGIAGGVILTVTVVVVLVVVFIRSFGGSPSDGSLPGEWRDAAPDALVDSSGDCHDATFTLRYRDDHQDVSGKQVDGYSCDIDGDAPLDGARVDYVTDSGWVDFLSDMLDDGDDGSAVFGRSGGVTVGASNMANGSSYTLYHLDSSAGRSIEVESFASLSDARTAAEMLGM